LSRQELENLTRRYATEISVLMGPESDIPAPDMGTDSQIMAWIMDTYSMHKGYSVPAVVTGKPVSIGGSLGRGEATGRGVMIITQEVCKHLGMPFEGATVVVQGYGKVGVVAAYLLQEQGCKIIAASDTRGCIYNPDGFDACDVLRHKKETKSVVGYPGADTISSEEFWELPCDILIPAAMEGQITAENAPRIEAKLIVEGANGPTTPDADMILRERGIPVIPDILANAGGVIVSYFEWVQGLQSFFWSEEEINRKLETIITKSFADVWAVAQERGVDMRTAALVRAINRVAEALLIRGIYP